MTRPVLFIARSWHGHGGMQQLNRDVCQYVGAGRASFLCSHPSSRYLTSFVSFCLRSLFLAYEWRQKNLRVHVADVAALPLGVLCSWITRSSLSCTACGLDVVYRPSTYQALIRFCLKRCDQVICISSATAEEVERRGVSRDRITIIPCGIHPSILHEQEREPQILLTVGRLVERKGVAWFLLNVFPRLLKTHADLHYCIVGDGPERKHILSIIKKLHLESSVTLMPRVSDEERRMLLERSMIFVAPNISIKGDMEGFGIVCLEAADAGLQIAAANLEGLKDAVIDGQTGRFFDSGDVNECAHVVQQMLVAPLRSVHVHDANARRFDWDQLVPLYHRVFDR